MLVDCETSTQTTEIIWIHLLFCCQTYWGLSSPVTIGNQQHPSILWQDFTGGVLLQMEQQRAVESHWRSPVSHRLSPASSSRSTFPLSWLHHSFFLSFAFSPSTFSFFCISLSLSVHYSLWCWRKLNYTAMTQSWEKHRDTGEYRPVWDAEL